MDKNNMAIACPSRRNQSIAQYNNVRIVKIRMKEFEENFYSNMSSGFV